MQKRLRDEVREALLDGRDRSTGGYKAVPKFHRVQKGVGSAHSTAGGVRQHNLLRVSLVRSREGARLAPCFLSEQRAEIADEAENSGEDQKLTEEAIPEGQAGAFPVEGEGECLGMKVLGKPYSGKLNVRFDEGEQED